MGLAPSFLDALEQVALFEEDVPDPDHADRPVGHVDLGRVGLGTEPLPSLPPLGGQLNILPLGQQGHHSGPALVDWRRAQHGHKVLAVGFLVPVAIVAKGGEGVASVIRPCGLATLANLNFDRLLCRGLGCLAWCPGVPGLCGCCFHGSRSEWDVIVFLDGKRRGNGIGQSLLNVLEHRVCDPPGFDVTIDVEVLSHAAIEVILAFQCHLQEGGVIIDAVDFANEVVIHWHSVTTREGAQAIVSIHGERDAWAAPRHEADVVVSGVQVGHRLEYVL